MAHQVAVSPQTCLAQQAPWDELPPSLDRAFTSAVASATTRHRPLAYNRPSPMESDADGSSGARGLLSRALYSRGQQRHRHMRRVRDRSTTSMRTVDGPTQHQRSVVEAGWHQQAHLTAPCQHCAADTAPLGGQKQSPERQVMITGRLTITDRLPAQVSPQFSFSLPVYVFTQTGTSTADAADKGGSGACGPSGVPRRPSVFRNSPAYLHQPRPQPCSAQRLAWIAVTQVQF